MDRIEVHMNHIVVTLEESDLLALWSAVMDENGEEALAFLKECVVPQVPQSGEAPCDSTRLNPFLLKKRSG